MFKKLTDSRSFICLTIFSGILIFLLAATFNYFNSSQRKYTLLPQQKTTINNTSVTLENFEILENPDGTAKEFISTLTIDGVDFRVKVNQPIRLENGFLYQWAYVREWDIELYFPEIDLSYSGPDNSSFYAGDYRIEVGPFVPDFAVSGDAITTWSHKALNPAILVTYYQDDVLKGKQWVFSDIEIQTEPPDFEIRCEMAGFREDLFSVLSYVKSPGDYFVVAGIIILFTGCALLLFRNMKQK